MTYSPYEPAPPDPGERWSLNLPVAIGVVFVFMVAVIAWVVIDSRDSKSKSEAATTTSTSLILTPVTPPTSTTPPLLPTTTLVVAPVTTLPPVTTAPTTLPPVAPTTLVPPPTVAPGDTVPGDLGVSGYVMQQPPCSGYITIIASAIGDQATPGGIRQVLQQYPNSNYLRTDQTCTSLNPSVNGQPIYVVYFGPFAALSDACNARSQGPSGSYARELSNAHGPDEVASC